MKKIKVMSIFGTRPEAIKMCPLVRKLQDNDKIESIVCVTGQHRQMLDQVLKIFDVKADYDLNIMKQTQTLTSITSDVIIGLESILNEVKPNIVLVHGDTTTSFAAALAAFYAKIPVGHVEAGLRTYDRYSPFPEEINRNLTSKLATIHFAPTQSNADNLKCENIVKNVFITGNTVLDAFKYTVHDNYKFNNKVLTEIDFSKERFITMTAHRRENQGVGIENICKATLKLVENFSDIHVIYPVHLSPSVRNTVFPMLQNKERITLCDPIDVTDMHNLMSKSYFVMTDSGGLQEEAPSLGIPVLLMRTETERPEAVEAGTVKIVGTEPDVIYDNAKRLMTDKTEYECMAHATNPYGDGKASERIVDLIINECFV